MTVKELNKLLRKNKVPKDVRILNNPLGVKYMTEMNGVYYNESINAICFTLYLSPNNPYDSDPDWRALR